MCDLPVPNPPAIPMPVGQYSWDCRPVLPSVAAAAKHRLEGVFNIGLLGAHLPDGGPVGHASPQRLDRRCGTPPSRCEPHQRGHRVLPVARPHIGPNTHLQRSVLAERAARIAGSQCRISQNCDEQTRQVFGIVDDLPQHLVGCPSPWRENSAACSLRVQCVRAVARPAQ